MNGQHPAGRDPVIEQLIVVGVAVALVALAAWYWSDWLLRAGAAAALAVLRVPAMLSGGVQVPLVSAWVLEPAAVHVETLTRVSADRLTASMVFDALGIAGRALAPVLVPLALFAGFAGSRIRPDRRYRRQHTLHSMLGEHARRWSAARFAWLVDPSLQDDTPIAKPEDLLAQSDASGPRRPVAAEEVVAPARPAPVSELLPHAPPDQPLGPWMRSLRPEEWLAQRGIGITETGAGVEIALVSEALGRQLRRQWTGPACLSLPERGILAALVLFHARRAEEAERLTDDMATVFAERVVESLPLDPWHEPLVGMAAGPAAAPMTEAMVAAGLDSRIRSVTGDRKVADPLLRCADAHWYAETVLPALWVAGRRGRGILAPARFAWLRTVNRPVWYAISASGGHVAPAEAAGIVAHLKAEAQTGMPLALPRCRPAARALVDDYLDLSDERRERRQRRQNRQA